MHILVDPRGGPNSPELVVRHEIHEPGGFCRLSKSLRHLFAALACVAGLQLSASAQESFATDFPPSASFSETYIEVIKSETDDGWTDYWAEPGPACVTEINYRVSAKGINLQALTRDTPFSISMGDFDLSGVLGDDPKYTPGATSVRIKLTDEDWDTGNELNVGHATISWSATAITVKVEVSRPETYSVYYSSYAGDDDPAIEDTLDCSFEFGEYGLWDRTVYFTGSSKLVTKTVGKGDMETEVDLATVKLAGAIDATRPQVAFLNPTPGTITAAESATFRVSATDNIEVEDVLVSVNGGEFVSLQQVGTAWVSETHSLKYGRNVIVARAIDLDENESLDVISEVHRWTPLVVSISGQGSVTNGFAGSTLRLPGSRVNLTATPAAGHVFTRWTGSVESTNPSINLLVEPGTAVQANFVPSPFPALRGTYAGLVNPVDGAPTGSITGQLSPDGAFSARINLNGRIETITGKLDGNGTFTGTFPRKDLGPITVTLNLDVLNGTEILDGTLVDGSRTYEFSVGRSLYSATDPSQQAGIYTVVLPAPEESGQGDGWATLKVKPNGIAKFSGQFSDGRPFSYSTLVGRNGIASIYLQPAGLPVALVGTIEFRAEEGVSDLDGILHWIEVPMPGKAKQAKPFRAEYFSAPVALRGARYIAPPKGNRLLELANTPVNAMFAAGGEPLAQPLEKALSIAANNRVSVVSPGNDKLKLSFKAANGTFGGRFVDVVTGAKHKFRGVVLQSQNAGFGNFRAGSETGYVTVSAE